MRVLKGQNIRDLPKFSACWSRQSAYQQCQYLQRQHLFDVGEFVNILAPAKACRGALSHGSKHSSERNHGLTREVNHV